MKRSGFALTFFIAACGDATLPSSTSTDAMTDAGMPDAEAPVRCSRMELDLPFTLLGPGATRSPRVLVHEQRADGEVVQQPSPASLSVVIEGTAVSWRGDRFLAETPGEAVIHAELGACRVSSRVEVLEHSPFAAEILELGFGRGAGHGQDQMPEIVLGPPEGGGPYSGSLDVLSLGVGGTITIGFGALQIFDGPGPDFIVFENAFKVAGGVGIFAEPAVVSVLSPEGEAIEFACERSYPYRGCAGTEPVLSTPDGDRDPTDPTQAGGDAFDMDELADAADAIRILDVGTATTGTNSGFDLDAIALIHAWPRTVVGLSSAASVVSLVVGEQSLLPSIDAVLEDGRHIHGLRTHALNERPELVSTEGGILRALQPGTAELVFRAGPHQVTINIEVSSP